MFKKKPEIKNLSPLRSSDRRKLADQIIRDYQITVPEAQPPPADEAGAAATPPAAAAAAATTLSALRNSLLPEATSSARFTTTAGPSLAVVTGTLYVGAHAGQEERILWFTAGGRDGGRLLPTVYTLWQNPGLVPLLHTPDFVVDEKLAHGSDLMVPGLVKPRGAAWDRRAVRGAPCAVAGLRRATVPTWLGACEVDVARLGDDLRGQRGVALKGLHWVGDEAWSWRPLGAGGRDPPDALEGWPGLADAVGGLALDDADAKADGEDGEEDEEDDGGGAAVGHTPPPPPEKEALYDVVDVEDREPTTKEVDDAFHQAFLFALHQAKSSQPGPHHGFDFPLQASFLMSSMIQPHLRVQSPHYHIKKTSWKNAKKFIKHLDKARLLKSKDRSGGETVILDFDFDDAQVAGFRPYELPKAKAAGDAGHGKAGAGAAEAGGADPSVGQKISIQLLYRASPKLVPTLLPSKTDFYTGAQVGAAVRAYIAARPELGGEGAASVKLDAFLAGTVLGSHPTPADTQALAAGRIARGALQRRVVDDVHLCAPFHQIVRGDAPPGKPKAGPPPAVSVVVERRGGNKVVTRIANLEPFFIAPPLLAPELQRKCAGAASAGQLTGGRPGLLEVVVQGDQRKVVVADVLARRGIDSRWVDVVDKTKAKKK